MPDSVGLLILVYGSGIMYKALARADRAWLARLITRCERPEDFMKALERQSEDIKVVVQFAEV